MRYKALHVYEHYDGIPTVFTFIPDVAWDSTDLGLARWYSNAADQRVYEIDGHNGDYIYEYDIDFSEAEIY